MSFELAGNYGTFVILLSGIATLAFFISAGLDSNLRVVGLRLSIAFIWAPLVYSVASRTVGLGLVLLWPVALLLGLWILFTTVLLRDAPGIAAGAAVPFLIAAAFGLLSSDENVYDSTTAALHGHVALICVAVANLAAALCFVVNAFRSRHPESRTAALPAFAPTKDQ